MTTITVGDEFHQERTVALCHPFSSVLDALTSGDDIHAIDLKYIKPLGHEGAKGRLYLDAWNFVSTSEVLGVGGTALGRCTHSVFIVLANKDGGEIPKFCLKNGNL